MSQRKNRPKKGGKEKEWWDKDGEDGYTSAHDLVDWEQDDTVAGKDEGILDNNNGSKSDGDENQSDGNKEEKYGGKRDGGDDDDNKESGTKKGISGNEKKRKIPSRTSARGKKQGASRSSLCLTLKICVISDTYYFFTVCLIRSQKK